MQTPPASADVPPAGPGAFPAYAANPTYPPHTTPYAPTAAPAAAATVPPYQAAAKPAKSLSSSKVTLISLVLRLAQALLALISFSVMAAAKQYNLKFTSFKAFKFDLAVMVIVFVYALVQAALDVVELVSGSPIGGYIRAYLTALGDTVLSFLAFGAACAAAAITTDIECSGLSDYCGHVKGATAMSFLAWFVLVPSQVMSLAIAANFFRNS